MSESFSGLSAEAERPMMCGLEIHIPLETKQKLFCACPTNYPEAEEPNMNCCPTCTGMPGARPHPTNNEAIRSAVAVAHMLNCRMVYGEDIYFMRKHYPYPDLPSGYQRTSVPIAVEGDVQGVKIREIHIEEDPGQYNLGTGFVNYNRSGVPLIEVVTEPVFRSPEQVREFMRLLLRILKYSGKVKSDPGIIRADVNVSLEGGNRVEIKNINSIKGIYKAIKYEVMRQKNLLKMGKRIEQMETRAFLESQGITAPMRKKETVADYRYIPDPDLSTFTIDKGLVDSVVAELPEGPHQKVERFTRQYGLTREQAETISSEIELADMFEEVAKAVNPKLAAEWIRGELRKQLNYRGLDYCETEFKAEHLVELIQLVEQHKITDRVAQKILEKIIVPPQMPSKVVEQFNLHQIDDETFAGEVVEEALEENGKALQDYKAGKQEALNFLVGAVMEKTIGRVPYALVMRKINEILKE